MGMDLNGAGGSFRWNFFSWPRLLQIAEDYGWEPAGTLPPEPTPEDEEDTEEKAEGDRAWSGSYTTNDGQVVTAEDAANLADALEQALPDIPDEDVLAEYRTQHGIRLGSEEPEIADLDWFCGPTSKAHIADFIRYCRAGSFTIR
jgi:hypothetical protein